MRLGAVMESKSRFARACRKSRTTQKVMASVIVGPGWQAASAIIGLLEVADPGQEKAGNCLDPEKEAALTQLEIWLLQAWSRTRP